MSALLLLAGIGGVCGLVTALFLRRQPLLFAITISALIGTVAVVILFGVGEATTDYNQHGYSLVRALEAGVSAAILYGISAPFIGGIPAALFGYLCHSSFHTRDKKPSA